MLCVISVKIQMPILNFHVLTRQAEVYRELFYSETELQMMYLTRPKKTKTMSPVKEDDDDFVNTKTSKSR